MLDIKNIANEHVINLSPYQPGKPIEELQRELGIQDVIKLASNENPLGPSPQVIQRLAALMSDLQLYPDGSGYTFKNSLSRKIKCQPEQITLGNGSDEIFNFILKVFLQRGDAVMMSEYGFAAYAIAAKAIGAALQVVPAKQWGHDLDAMADAIDEHTKVIFLANPNNPTGTYFDKQSLTRFLERVPSRVLVVIDQAYYEYMSVDNYPNGLDYL